MAQRASATATELQSMGCRLDAGRGQGPIDDQRSNESCTLPLGKVITLCGTFMKGCQLSFRAKQRRANLICEGKIRDDQSE